MNDIMRRQRQAETFNRAQSSTGLRCSKSLSPIHPQTRERIALLCKQQAKNLNAAMNICLISTRVSSSTVKEAIFLCETEEGVGAEEYN